jgi:hypothetical protein
MGTTALLADEDAAVLASVRGGGDSVDIDLALDSSDDGGGNTPLGTGGTVRGAWGSSKQKRQRMH